MNLEKRILAFVKLGEMLGDQPPPAGLRAAIQKATLHNGWFTEENILYMMGAIAQSLKEDKIREWLAPYKIPETTSPGNIGVIMAGNIPLVGFHDFICVLLSGNTFYGKLSSDDEYLLPAVAKLLAEAEPGFAGRIHFTTQPLQKANGIAAYIATGSNNSARYFEYYFGKYPHIIRRNRNAIAILDGTESETDLKNLGKDIFQYFGLGCRNVAKIYVPEKYEFEKLFLAIADFKNVIHHNKYANNYNYYRSIYLMNKDMFWDNDFLMLKEEAKTGSPVATLYYERYQSEETLAEKLLAEKESIQCIVAHKKLGEFKPVPFGQTQSPELHDYADGVDTMDFLLSL